MKPTFLFAALSLVLASPVAMAKTELETLRVKCNEQELQIRQLEKENTTLRSGGRDEKSAPAKSSPAIAAKSTAAEPVSTAESSRSTYVVKAGDSMERIARKVGWSAQKLAQANDLKTSSIIHPGQKLKVPGAVPTPGKSLPVTAAVPDTAGKTHTVRDGETFFSISKKYRISAEALAAANPRVKAKSLHTGQVLSLSSKASPAPSSSSSTMISTPVTHAKAAATHEKTAAPKTATEAPRSAVAESKPAPTHAPAAEEKAVAETSDKKLRSVTIDGETTYGEFASKHGTDAERLNALNGLDLTKATVLAKGSELYVPVQP